MIRRLLTVASAVSLLLCASIAVLWIRSYWRSDVITFNVTHRATRQRSEYRVEIGRGVLFAQRTSLQFSTPEAVGVYLSNLPAPGLEEGMLRSTEPLEDWMYIGGNFPTYWGFGFGSQQYATPHETVWEHVYVALRPWDLGTVYHVERGIVCPLWSVCLLFALIPAQRAWVTLRRRHRSKTGLCACCGYSLRGNASGVCPECGTPIPSASEANA